FFFCTFFIAPPTTPLSTLSLHDALPISLHLGGSAGRGGWFAGARSASRGGRELRETHAGRGNVQYLPGGAHHSKGTHQVHRQTRSEEHTSELQSLAYLVCRLLLEKKKKK